MNYPSSLRLAGFDSLRWCGASVRSTPIIYRGSTATCEGEGQERRSCAAIPARSAPSPQLRHDAATRPLTLVGRHTGEDPNDRPPESLALAVIEAGSEKMDGRAYVAGLGAQTVGGVEDPPTLLRVRSRCAPS